MGHYLEARLTDGRAVQIDFHDNPAWKDTDRLAGRIEVSYANRPQAEWQYDDNDMALSLIHIYGTTVTEIAHGQGDEARRLRGMIRLRDLARELQRLELDPARVDDCLLYTSRCV